MKKNLIVVLLAVISVAAVAQSKNAVLYLSKSLTNDAIKNIDAKTSGGSIEVFGNNERNARIEVYVSPNGAKEKLSKEEIEQRLRNDYVFSVTVDNHQLKAYAKTKSGFNNWRRALSVSYKIYVGTNVSTLLSTSGGSITISDLKGVQNFTTSGGSLSVENITGKVTGRTSGGSIDVKNARPEIDLSTSGGSIDANNCEGKIGLTTSGGSLKLNDLKGNIEASTSGGSIHAENISGELNTSTSGGSIHLHKMACSVDASTSGGHISADFVEVGKYIKLGTSAGGIELSIPKNKGYNLNLKADRINTTLNNFSGTSKKNRIEGKLNGGGIPLEASTSAGSITLSFN